MFGHHYFGNNYFGSHYFGPAVAGVGPVASGNVTLPNLIFASKSAGATLVLKPLFNFLSEMGTTDTIVSAVVTATVFTGVDPSPSLILSGSPTISGTKVSQKVTGGVVGVIYSITCAATISTGEVLEQSGFLAVEPDLVA